MKFDKMSAISKCSTHPGFLLCPEIRILPFSGVYILCCNTLTSPAEVKGRARGQRGFELKWSHHQRQRKEKEEDQRSCCTRSPRNAVASRRQKGISLLHNCPGSIDRISSMRSAGTQVVIFSLGFVKLLLFHTCIWPSDKKLGTSRVGGTPTHIQLA